jgi:hypothetical protein
VLLELGVVGVVPLDEVSDPPEVDEALAPAGI